VCPGQVFVVLPGVHVTGRGGRCPEDADRLGFWYQAVHSFSKYALRSYRVRCRGCKCDLNPAVAQPQDDRKVYCLACLARRPTATFGQHLKAYRLDTSIFRWFGRHGTFPSVPPRSLSKFQPCVEFG
jgi:hypothetical protein